MLFAAGVASFFSVGVLTEVVFAYAERSSERLDALVNTFAVEPIRYLRDSAGLEGTGADSEKWQNRLREDLQDAGLTLRAVLTDMPISLSDLMTARPGDIIPTDIPSTVRLMADDQPIMSGALGVSKGMNAVRIDEPVNRRLLGENYGRRNND